MNSSTRQQLTTAQVAAYVDTTSTALNLEIPAQYRASVIANLERLLELGGQVMSFPLPDDTEMAPVFQP
jgi:hypothetical protein